ncbi:TIGR03617 family F420-dependent LLM class oxidoreductase [Cryobacterium psychrophilum]|uniref:TIGR03617 family F420-dependent LLM class oxidoreductase n=1 Tax=Cryobacterium psychrophilum TaxID=41988 RepID=A0A4Y8KJI5_9MICO|nr:TIGR03617 family F420-dependent LLM class oxidoreductase [Cryobacterium psychrophilum]TDW28827.1 putative F420-dependent oxidoreductase [Cryobacterium psychrophilum]TFD76202.1 TIGR03617 family F420-dependent LLM class oxidoreductase [Cryobacterium psychrophilum]
MGTLPLTPTFALDFGSDVRSSPLETERMAITAEAAGYDGVLVTEITHDPFIGLALAARATERVRLMSGIAVAFARNPMSMATLGNDIHLVSEGRFVLGLGSQVRPHIERRFSMPWSQPAKRMNEYILAVRAIWESWSTGGRLDFRGEFYQHTLMTPFFDPGPNPHGNAPIWLAAVGERMTEVAGSAADGLISHSFTTRDYLEQVSLPALRRGRASAGREAGVLQVSVPALVAIGTDQSSLDAAALATRKQIAFYGSTEAYRPVLALHGWEQLADGLHAASRRGEWDAMAQMIDDDVLHAFAVTGSPAEVAAGLRERFSGIATRLTLNAPYEIDPLALDAVLAELAPR